MRADAGYVLGRITSGESTLEVTTRRAKARTVMIASTGEPYVAARGGHRLVYVTLVESHTP